MTTVSDNFVRAGPSLGANWISNNFGGSAAGIQLINNAFASATGSQTAFGTTIATWAGAGAGSFGPDQYTQATLSAISIATSTISITGCTQAAGVNTYTYTLTAGAALVSPQQIVITGMTNGANNGVFGITGLGSGNFTANVAGGITEAGSTGTGVSSADSLGCLAVRNTNNGANSYFVLIGNNSGFQGTGTLQPSDNRVWAREFWKNVSSAATFLTGNGLIPAPIPDAVNDVFIWASFGTKLQLFKNTVSLLAFTDASLTGGTPGICVSSIGGPNEWVTGPVTSVGNSGTQFTNWIGSDAPSVPANWTRRASETFMQNGTIIGANWTQSVLFNGVSVQGQSGIGTTPASGFAGATYTGRTWSPNQSAQFVLYKLVGNTSIYLYVRSDATNATTCYLAQIIANAGFGAGTFTLLKYIGGTQFTVHSAVAVTNSFMDVIRIEAVGSTITMRQNGNIIIQVGDNSIASGSPGIMLGGPTLTQVTYWAGDEFTGSAGGGGGFGGGGGGLGVSTDFGYRI